MVDPQAIDIDFPSCPEYVFGNAGRRAFGAGAFASYGDVVPEVPESQWPELAEKLESEGGGLDQLVTRIYDQQREGSCVANACCQSMEILQAKQLGEDEVVHLSAMSVYKFIGRSPQSGATLDDGLEQIANVGAVPLDTPENRAKFGDIVMPNTGWSTPMPPGWQGVAKRFRGTEWFICQSVNQLISALFNGHPVVVGRAGHSIAYCRPVYQSGRLLAKYANSWSEDWQDGGFGYDSLNYIRQSASWAFALRSVVVPSTTA